ncbi:MAG: glycosyltransferase family 2 protein [Acidiferrobacteraceae bacterium]
MALLDVLIPTCGRAGALSVTLAGLCAQTQRSFRVVISDQTEYGDAAENNEVRATVRLLRAHGHSVELHKHLPRRGLAEQRDFLLRQVRAEYCLFLDDDVMIEPDLIDRLFAAIRSQGCGFVGSAVIGLSHIDDVRPDEQAIEFWEGPVTPEHVTPESPAWERHRLHNAANLYHVQTRIKLAPGVSRLYKVAWVGGCVLYSTQALQRAGGFSFWRELPPDHCGEDVLAQLRVMAQSGGCGILPSGAYHQELATTVRSRGTDAAKILDITITNSAPGTHGLAASSAL